MRKLLLIKTQDAFVRLLLSSYGKIHLLRNRLTRVSLNEGGLESNWTVQRTETGRSAKVDGLEIKNGDKLIISIVFLLFQLPQSVHFMSNERPVWTKTVQFGSRPSNLDQYRPVWINTIHFAATVHFINRLISSLRTWLLNFGWVKPWKNSYSY